MTRMLLGVTIAIGMLLGAGPPAAFAGGALIETTAPLADRSEASIKAAVVAAIDKAVRGAVAMGFAWFQLRDARLAGDEVAIRIVATDEEPGDAAETDPGESPGAESPDAMDDEPAEDSSPVVPIPAAPRLHI